MKNTGSKNSISTAILNSDGSATAPADAPQQVKDVIAAANAAGAPNDAGYTEEVKLFGECFGTEEMKEGVGAFLEKRAPRFS
mgnify:CR=1 FL=1